MTVADYDFRGFEFSRPVEGVLLISISRPERANALNAEMHESLRDIWSVVDEDPEARVAVLTGTGPAFCAGGDFDLVESFAGSFEQAMWAMESARSLVNAMIDCSKPIISAVNGPAVGAGLAAALMADIVVASEDARFIDGHSAIGVAPGDHAVLIWPLLMGLGRAKYYLLTGAKIDGRRAYELGLAAEVVGAAELLPRAMEIASQVAEGPTWALRATKRSLNGWLKMFEPAFEASLAHEILTMLSPDAAEGIAATREKRVPDFRRDANGRA